MIRQTDKFALIYAFHFQTGWLSNSCYRGRQFTIRPSRGLLQSYNHVRESMLSVSLRGQDAAEILTYLMAHPNGAVAPSGNNSTWETFIMRGFENELTLQRLDNFNNQQDSGYLRISELAVIQINCVDTRIAGAYHLLEEITGKRIHYESKNLSIPTGRWAAGMEAQKQRSLDI